jgi:acyl-CoA hydrolase
MPALRQCSTLAARLNRHNIIKMDTDDLSIQTYEAILETAEKFNHNLTIQFGILADSCSNDDSYLESANNLITEWRNNMDNTIEDIFFDTKKPMTITFEKVLMDIQQKIETVKKIPLQQRKFEF